MAEQDLQGFRVAILATDLFEESELVQPQEALKAAGAKVTVVAPKSGEIQGVNHAEKGLKVKVDQTLDNADPDQFDAVLLPGGAMNADALRVNKLAQDFVRNIDQSGRPIAVICHGPWLLISAGLTKRRKLTSYHTIQDDVRNSGAEWQDSECLRDRNWVSSRHPTDIPRFNQGMLKLFSESNVRGQKVA